MRLNDYRCRKCKHEFERWDDEPNECPKCKSKSDKMISAVQFKISGYCYNNEYKKK